MPYCQLSHVNMYYEEIGEGRPVLMIHGFGLDHRVMTGCMEPIFEKRSSWRRIYIDLPGMGKSKNYDTIKNSDAMLEAVLDFIDAIVPNQKLLIAGESYGGYLTRGVIAKRKEWVDGVALICPMIIPEAEKRTLPNHTIMHADEEFLSRLTEEERKDFSMNSVVLNEDIWKRYNEDILSGIKISNQEFLDRIKSQYGFSIDVDENDFAKPSIFLMGKQDSAVGYQDAFRIINQYPRLTLSVLDKAGHNLQIEQSELFRSLIEDWLKRVEEDGK